MKASANEASRRLARRARKPPKIWWRKRMKKSPPRKSHQSACLQFLVEVNANGARRESSAKVTITKHMPAKVKRLAAKASRKVPGNRLVCRGVYITPLKFNTGELRSVRDVAHGPSE